MPTPRSTPESRRGFFEKLSGSPSDHPAEGISETEHSDFISQGMTTSRRSMLKTLGAGALAVGAIIGIPGCGDPENPGDVPDYVWEKSSKKEKNEHIARKEQHDKQVEKSGNSVSSSIARGVARGAWSAVPEALIPWAVPVLRKASQAALLLLNVHIQSQRAPIELGVATSEPDLLRRAKALQRRVQAFHNNISRGVIVAGDVLIFVEIIWAINRLGSDLGDIGLTQAAANIGSHVLLAFSLIKQHTRAFSGDVENQLKGITQNAIDAIDVEVATVTAALAAGGSTAASATTAGTAASTTTTGPNFWRRTGTRVRNTWNGAGGVAGSAWSLFRRHILRRP